MFVLTRSPVIEMRDGVPPMNDVHPMIAMRRVRMMWFLFGVLVLLFIDCAGANLASSSSAMRRGLFARDGRVRRSVSHQRQSSFVFLLLLFSLSFIFCRSGAAADDGVAAGAGVAGVVDAGGPGGVARPPHSSAQMQTEEREGRQERGRAQARSRRNQQGSLFSSKSVL